LFLAALLIAALSLMACGDDASPAADGEPTAWLDSGVASPAPDQLTPTPGDMAGTTDDSGAPSTSCPDVTGTWEGTLQGTTTGFFTFQVGGKLWAELKAGDTPGNYVVVKGEMTSWAKGFELFPFKQPMQGEVKCGVLAATGDVNIMGVQSTGTTSGKFVGDKCTGTWKGGSADGSSSGSGTFEMTRKSQ